MKELTELKNMLLFPKTQSQEITSERQRVENNHFNN